MVFHPKKHQTTAVRSVPKGVSQHKPPKSSAAIAYGWMKRFTGEMVILKWPCLVDSILMVLTVNNG
jgi:hypothetical protein